jgi:hypothetical protein
MRSRTSKKALTRGIRLYVGLRDNNLDGEIIFEVRVDDGRETSTGEV